MQFIVKMEYVQPSINPDWEGIVSGSPHPIFYEVEAVTSTEATQMGIAQFKLQLPDVPEKYFRVVGVYQKV